MAYDLWHIHPIQRIKQQQEAEAQQAKSSCPRRAPFCQYADTRHHAVKRGKIDKSAEIYEKIVELSSCFTLTTMLVARVGTISAMALTRPAT